MKKYLITYRDSEDEAIVRQHFSCDSLYTDREGNLFLTWNNGEIIATFNSFNWIKAIKEQG